MKRSALRAFAAAVLVAGACAPVTARTLEEIRSLGEISMCANPDALPHASEKGDAPGFQVEIGRALAAALGVRLKIDWIVPRLRAGLVNCPYVIRDRLLPLIDREIDNITPN